MTRFDYSALHDFATNLAVKLKLPGDRAEIQSDVLLEADLMGHTTHGLALLPGLLGGLESSAIRVSGEPEVLSDKGSAVMWDADRLPGTWLMTRAIREARARLTQHPVMTIVIKRITHIAALGAYLRQATDHGLIILIMNSDPSMRTVTPAGGAQPQLAANPLAFGYPTNGDPILIDISSSAVANGWVRRWAAEGKHLPGQWLLDAQGNPTDDPNALFGNPRGAMLPLGGLDMGHKGFALGLIVEVMTAGLSGLGRADGLSGDAGTPVFIQLIDPAAFAGGEALKREAGWLADACRATSPRPGVSKVRMPGDTALASRKAQLKDGVALYPTIMPELKKWADKLGVSIPGQLAA